MPMGKTRIERISNDLAYEIDRWRRKKYCRSFVDASKDIAKLLRKLEREGMK